jgi:hypothetical protein
MESLKEAIREGDLRKVRKLIDEGAKTNARHLRLAADGPVWGYEETHKNGYIKIVKLLLELGVKVNAKDKDGNTALHIAAVRRGSGYVDILKILINAGANVNTANNKGITPMHRAVRCLENTKLLLDAGADINATDSEGKTPLDILYLIKNGSEIHPKQIKENFEKTRELMFIAGALHSKKIKAKINRQKREKEKIDKIMQDMPNNLWKMK